MSIVTKTDTGVRIRVFAQPKSSKNEIIGPHQDAIKIKITAPPVDGKANECLIEFLAKTFSVAKRNVQLLKGDISRIKTFEIVGVDISTAEQLLKIKP